MRTATLAFALCVGQAQAGCVEERAFLLDVFEGNGWTVEDMGALADFDGTCTLTDLVLVESKLVLDTALLTWRIEGSEALTSGSGKVTLLADLNNLRMIPRVGDAWMSYMLNVQNRRSFIDGSLQAFWDLDEGLIEVAGLRFDLPGDNEIGLEFRAYGASADLLSGKVADLAALQIGYLALEIENHGIADALILPPMIGAMSGLPGTPETVVEATKAEATGIVQSLPSALFDASSKDALSRLIADGPAPWGELFVSLSSEPPLPLSNLLPLSLAPDPLSESVLLEAFPNTTLSVSYIAAPEDE